MLVEARILDGQHGLLHQLGDLLDRPVAATLLTELAHQHAVAGEHAHRQLGAVVCQPADVRQVGVGERQPEREQQGHSDNAAGQQSQAPQGQLTQANSE